MTQKNNNPNFTLEKIQDQEILTIKGAPVPCIYKNAVILPHPTLAGQGIVHSPTCGVNCPMFEVSDGKPWPIVTLHCTGRKLYVYQKDELPGSQLTLLS